MNMEFISNKQKAIMVVITLLLSFGSFGQKLIESRKSSYYTYIYKITQKEAEEVYKKDYWKVKPSYFHTLVDSFPTDSLYSKKLQQGHYLKTFAKEEKQKVTITSIQDFDVFICNNSTDLCIQVLDLQGKLIEDATVSVRSKELHFDKKTHSYLDKKSNRKGLLKVSYHGFTAYYNLYRNNQERSHLGYRKKVVLQNGRVDTINIFDGYQCEYGTNLRFSSKHTGYLVFNKPKYLPGDTVKFKAFLSTTKGKPIDKMVNVILKNGSKDIKLTKLAPYRSGGYKYEFYLDDSLQLKLDRNYTIHLKQNDRKEYINGYFRYEDYELSKNQLSLRVDKSIQFRNKKITLYAKGTDENDLNLMDARIEVLLTPESIDDYYENHAFIPDTLLFLKKKLDPIHETKIVLSDSLFPKANFDYAINVRLITSDNESVSKSEMVDYFYKSKRFDIEVKTDSIHFEYLKNGKSESTRVTINAQDNFGNKSSVYKGMTPCDIKLNPYFSSYTIETDSISKSIYIYNQPSLLQCVSKRTKDSVSIVVNNPRKLPFIYNIYKKNEPQANGYTDSLDIHKKISTEEDYYVSIRYIWGGKVRNKNIRIPLIDKKLNISVTEPKIVYPGQKSRIDILVTDIDGKPVEGVDLTAYSLTKKFGYSAPNLPYLGKEKKGKKTFNNFSLKRPYKQVTKQLDYNAWKILAGLDSIEYYRFIYPQNSIYRFEYTTSDSITQFAPFVVSKGTIKPIHVIYVDNKPVYFSWSTNIRPYSFHINSGYHQIRLRTNEKEITVDSLYFKKGKKLILSLDQDIKDANIKSQKVKSKLSRFEQQVLQKYIVPYEDSYEGKYAYIEHNGDFQLLAPESKYIINHFMGPLTGDLNLHVMDSCTTTFQHEPLHEYEFFPTFKIRHFDSKRYRKYLSSNHEITSLNDSVLTKQVIEKRWKDDLYAKKLQRARYRNPNYTSRGAGKLLIDYKQNDKPIKDMPLNILVYRYDNPKFVRVYSKDISYIHQLKEGFHKLVFFYPGGRYHIVDSLYIQPNGLNYYKLKQPISLKKDSFSFYLSSVIEEMVYKTNTYFENEERKLKLKEDYKYLTFHWSDNDRIVTGYVYDEETREPLPGVTVSVEGGTYGITTNIDGCYTIVVPDGCSILNFTYIGYQSRDEELGSINTLNVSLKQEENSLDEVLITGYGVKNTLMQTSSISTATTNTLQWDMSRDISTDRQGSITKVSFSSNRSGSGNGIEIRINGGAPIIFDQKPLYVINGNIYSGDITALDPSVIEDIKILKDVKDTAIYGVNGANGVVIIKTKAGAFNTTSPSLKGADYDDTFLESAGQSNSIRNNFSDYAFWQPSLTTDKNGRTGFDVRFPDDVTSWQTFYLAMNGHKQSGQSNGHIKSYKPLMAQLAVPRFLVQSDSAYAIGKVLNYTSDSIKVKTNFEANGEELLDRSRFCNNALIDTVLFTASKDSVKLKYCLESKDGYFDGEQRTIAVYPKGLEETEGKFYVLDKDTTLQLQLDPNLGKVKLYAQADIIDVIDNEINHLISYRYFCNEQIASKLKALLAEKNIANYKGVKFKKDNKINKLIRLLMKNQNKNGLWGWWKNSDESLWISLHILEAITHAEQLGYKNSINKKQITELLIWELERPLNFNQKIRVVKILNLLDAKINDQRYISELEKSKDISLNGLLNIIELKQHSGMECHLDTLDYYKKTTIFGNTYYSDENKETDLLDNDIQNTLLAYKVIKVDSVADTLELKKIQNYLLENRKEGQWRNTYESAQIIETILPDLLKGKAKLNKPRLSFKGDITKTVTEFPFEMTINPTQKIEVSKTGDFPIYLTTYQSYWNDSPSLKKEDFEISTSFENKSTPFLEAGQETKLITKVTVKKDAEYVMINIPIPGGCSYADKKNYWANESHREYYKNKTTIFCDHLPKGEYTFEVKLISRYSGTYTINPARIELMYFPTFNANNEIKTIKIK